MTPRSDGAGSRKKEKQEKREQESRALQSGKAERVRVPRAAGQADHTQAAAWLQAQ